jgi:hypothetical protein
MSARLSRQTRGHDGQPPAACDVPALDNGAGNQASDPRPSRLRERNDVDVGLQVIAQAPKRSDKEAARSPSASHVAVGRSVPHLTTSRAGLTLASTVRSDDRCGTGGWQRSLNRMQDG